MLPAEPVNSDRAQQEFNAVVQAAGCDPASEKLACLRSLNYTQYNAAVNTLPAIFAYESLNLQYIVRPDPTDGFFPASPEKALFAGAYAKVPILIGDLEDEGTLFSVTSFNVTTTQLLVTSLQDYFQSAPQSAVQALVDSYPVDQAAGSPFRTDASTEIYPGYKRLSAIIGDVFFTLTRRVLLNQVCQTVQCWSWLGTYNHGSSVLGTAHGDDLPPTFQNAPTNPLNLLGAPGLLDYYLSFVVRSNPNSLIAQAVNITWPTWQQSNPTLVKFGRLANTLIPDTFRTPQYNTFSSLVSVLAH